MSHAKIRKVFENILITWAQTKGLRVAFENVQFEPVADETYIQSYLKPVNTRTRTLTGSDHTEYSGMYQINFITNKDEGVGYVNDLAEELIDLYPVYSELGTNFKVRVMTPITIMDGLEGNAKYTLPVFFRYRADV